jgi:asparagine synthase (glutamine-hydrolysing)
MCGICGEVRFDGTSPDGPATAEMTKAMTARGPDGAGVWRQGRVALGHRRLAIIDLTEAGAQPMVDDEAQLAIAFNGCIYNHRELRRELERLGHRFRSTSDTEVVLRAYREWGDGFVDRLVGMFAFALVDRRSERTLLGRDRLGIKPLYVADVPGGLRFASTVPALLAAGGIDTSLDPVALHHYLSWHSIVPPPRTILRGVRKLPPATLRVIESDGRARDKVYWHPPFARGTGADWSPQQWRQRLLDALRTAVERRMVADVPVGVLLSGGVDSSLIVALLAEAGVEDLLTFSIGFDSSDGQEGDEFRYSDQIAKRFATDHRRLLVPTRDVPDAIAPTVAAMSEPMASHDVLAFYLLAEQVSQHVKVVQSGQGADEVFAGYEYYQPLAGVPRDDAAAAFAGSFTDIPHDEVLAALSAPYRIDDDAGAVLLERACAEPGADTALDAVLRLELMTLMPDDPVKRVDNMTMAWGLEARVPFLDHELVELAAAAPPELKLAQGGKGILKDIARPLIGAEVVDRPKGYFPVPAVSNLDGSLLDHVVDVLRSPAAKERGLIEPSYVDALLEDPARRFAGSGDRLWLLGVLEMWLQAHRIEG